MKLEKPALLLEICGALPYAPDLGGVISTRSLPLLTFLGLEQSSSIGAFQTAVCGYARANSLPLKDSLRNNKTTLASGPGSEAVSELHGYLHSILRVLHRIWYNATRSSQEQVAVNAVKEAEAQINFALKGENRNPLDSGNTLRDPKTQTNVERPPVRRHRWECASCEHRWLVEAGFSPTVCAETAVGKGKGTGCGSDNIGLSKNQPRIADCKIRLRELPDDRIPSQFQFERVDESVEQPVVDVNITCPRYIELRGDGSVSRQGQVRLVQYLIDVSLFAIADNNARVKKSDLAEELGDLYYKRMIRTVGIKRFKSQRDKILKETDANQEAAALMNGDSTEDSLQLN